MRVQVKVDADDSLRVIVVNEDADGHAYLISNSIGNRGHSRSQSTFPSSPSFSGQKTMEATEKSANPSGSSSTSFALGNRITRRLYTTVCAFALVLSCFNIAAWWTHSARQLEITLLSVKSHCPSVQPIQADEFHRRQSDLVNTLRRLNASAYIAEPGGNAQYYANISTSNWRLSERPLLLVISPSVTEAGIEPQISILTPKFEATRAGLLAIPSSSNVTYIPWPEESNPYEILSQSLKLSKDNIYVDSSTRHFIVDGIQKAAPGASVISAPVEITSIRSRKSPTEIEILKCANEVTLEVIRHVRSKMYIGMHESDAREMISEDLASAGLSDGRCLTLFGENAALPHGSGTDRSLGRSDFALFDCTPSLYGYWADVTRTVALKESKIPPGHIALWNLVHTAQSIALSAAKSGVKTGDVDHAARSFLGTRGFGEFFTHRLGHGIGAELHEEPYLRGGSNDSIQSGHTFSDEPGIYIEGKVGIRLEDCFYIDESGKGVFLTEAVGGQAKSPWDP